MTEKEIKDQSDVTFEKLWDILKDGDPMKMMAKDIWREGWDAAFKKMMPRIGSFNFTCSKLIEELDGISFPSKTFDDLKELMEVSDGFEEPVMVKLREQKEEIKSLKEEIASYEYQEGIEH